MVQKVGEDDDVTSWLTFFNICKSLNIINLGNITTLILNLGCVSLRKSKIGFLNPKESENGLCVSLLNRSIQDLPDHGVSKEPKNPLPAGVDSSVPLPRHDPKDLGLICLAKKRKVHFRIHSDLRIQSWIFLEKQRKKQSQN